MSTSPSSKKQPHSQTLRFESSRVAQQIYNNDPRNLQALEEVTGVKAIAREDWIRLDGSEQAVQDVQKLFSLLESSIKSGSSVRTREFHAALSVLKHDGVQALKELLSERVQTSPQKSPVSPKTVGQRKYIEAIRANDVTLGIGPAGTGKTYLAMAMAVAALKDGKASRIILTRPAVEAGEALGFLPGDLYEKLAPYLRPLHDALHDMMPVDEIQRQTERGVIEIAPLAYMRGRTLNNAFIILDEAQNSTAEQMFMFLTRLGHSSKAVITGDITQIDLPSHKHSGLIEARIALQGIDGIGIVEFQKKDVVRHPLVQKIINAYETHRGKAQ